MKRLLLALAVVLALAIVNGLLYVSADGMECQGDSCSTTADVTGALFFPLLILSAVLLVAVVARAALGLGDRSAGDA